VIALYVLGAILILLLIGVILAPLLEREPPDVELEELPPRDRYEGALEALREVEFEYRTEKLPEDEYQRLKARYGRIALEAEGALSEGEAEEARQAARTEAPTTATAPGRDGTPGSGAELRACGNCGEMIPVTARFCPRCGESQGSSGRGS